MKLEPRYCEHCGRRLEIELGEIGPPVVLHGVAHVRVPVRYKLCCIQVTVVVRPEELDQEQS